MVNLLALMLVIWTAFALAMLELKLPAAAIREGPAETSSDAPVRRAPDAMTIAAIPAGPPRKAWLDDVVRFSHVPVRGRNFRALLTPFDEPFGLFSPDGSEHDPDEA